MIRDTLSLARVRWLFVKNHFVRPTSNKVLRWGLILGLGGSFLVADYTFFFKMIGYLDGLPMQIGEELIVQLLNVMILTLFAMVLFSATIASLSIFYMSSDLELLNSLPVHPMAILNSKIYQTLINASWVVAVFGLPIFVSYGNYFQGDAGYYLYLIVSFLMFALIPSLWGAMGIMLLMRFFPTEKAHQILSFLGLFFLVGLVMFFRFLSPEKFFHKDVSDEMIMQFVESLRVPEFSFLPTSWFTRGLTAWIEGDTGLALQQLGQLGFAAFIFALAFLWTGRRIYFQGWRSFQEVRNAPKDRSVKSSTMTWLRWIPLARIQKALLMKDFKVFLRDPAHWSQFFILIALVVVYLFNIYNLPLDNLVLKNVVSVLNIGLVGFVLAGLVARFVFSTTSIEGKKMWVIYSSPVNMRSFLWAKFWMYFPPLVVVGEFLVVASNYLLQVDAYVMNVSIVGVFLITLGLVGMGVGMGAMYPQFDYENISEIATGTGGILFMISSLMFVGIVLILGARPIHLHLKEKFLLQAMEGIDVPILYSLIIMISLIVTFEPMRRGIQTLRTRDL